jgi:hypothetical protein
LAVQEIKGAKIRRGSLAGRSKNGSHARRKSGGRRRGSNRGSSSRAKDKELQLGSGEKGEAIGGIIRKEISAGRSAKSLLLVIS